ncbi:mitochondrial glycine transporter Ymc1p [[Candida] jaroonii]|uniref:Mitochondrial glycine transporter Ymc1p n=1 Tax=[Candida] jaroonii TaxID=467808 RepID=A0ACA9Y5N9_9ASCO|nr:mitochondrial glycine transporter Ymc1p [[Candida] jaroonii]
MTDNSISRKVKDITAGFVGGATQVLIGQPFDLIKIRLQTSNSTITQVFQDVVKKEGILSFYKGTLPPLFGVGACVSLQFYGFHETKRYFESKSGKSLTWKEIYLSGAMAGIVNTPVASPVEQLRILSQSSSTKIHMKELIGDIYKNHGFKGIFRGFNITLLREIQSYGVWFLSYETIIRSVVNYHNYESRDSLSTPELLLSGAAAGNLLWLSAYPLDVIKSNIQSDSFKNPKFNGVNSVVKYIYSTYGLRGFWKGIGPCLVRATPCSAGTFASVELALRMLN